MKKILSLLLILAMLAGTMSGCTNAIDNSGYVPTGDALLLEGQDPEDLMPEEESDQELTLAYYPDRRLNPLFGSDYINRILMSLMYQPLFAVDNNKNVTPILCGSYQVSANSRTWTFYVDENATYSDGTKVTAVTVDTKRGSVKRTAKAFIDATGDADLCAFAGEKTVEFAHNSRTGWYFSFDGTTGGTGKLQLHGNSDSYYPTPADDKPHYNGLDPDDISRHMIDMHRFILEDTARKREQNPNHFPLLIPAFHGLRTTRRLSTSMEFSEDNHERVWFEDAIGMIGNWKKSHKRYSIPYRCCKAETYENLYAAGRCVSADRSGWDLTRVIPTCAVTGEATGVAAAMQANTGCAPAVSALQAKLTEKGVPLDKSLFDRTM